MFFQTTKPNSAPVFETSLHQSAGSDVSISCSQVILSAGEGEAEVKRIALDFQDWRAAGTMFRVPWWLGCTMEKVSWCTSVTTVRRRTRRRVARPAW